MLGTWDMVGNSGSGAEAGRTLDQSLGVWKLVGSGARGALSPA
jgi:hypothetical protein